MTMPDEERFLCEAIELTQANVAKGGRPFGAVVVKDGAIDQDLTYRLFKPRELLTDGGLRHVETPSGLDETAPVDDGDKRAKKARIKHCSTPMAPVSGAAIISINIM